MSVEKAKPALFSPALMRAALDGSYALDEWRRLDGQPLLDGVFETNANVGIGGALFAGFAVPLFLESIRANTDRAALASWAQRRRSTMTSMVRLVLEKTKIQGAAPVSVRSWRESAAW